MLKISFIKNNKKKTNCPNNLNYYTTSTIAETYSESNQRPKIEPFKKIVNSFQVLKVH